MSAVPVLPPVRPAAGPSGSSQATSPAGGAADGAPAGSAFGAIVEQILGHAGAAGGPGAEGQAAQAGPEADAEAVPADGGPVAVDVEVASALVGWAGMLGVATAAPAPATGLPSAATGVASTATADASTAVATAAVTAAATGPGGEGATPTAAVPSTSSTPATDLAPAPPAAPSVEQATSEVAGSATPRADDSATGTSTGTPTGSTSNSPGGTSTGTSHSLTGIGTAAPSTPTAGPAAPADAPAPAARVTGQVFPEVTRLASTATPGGTQRLTLTLQPEQLGEVRVVMVARPGQALQVDLVAGTDARRALLEGSSELRRLLEGIGAGDARVVVREATSAGAASYQQGASSGQPWSGSGTGSDLHDAWEQASSAAGDGGAHDDRGAGTRAGDRATDGTPSTAPGPATSPAAGHPIHPSSSSTSAARRGLDVTV